MSRWLRWRRAVDLPGALVLGCGAAPVVAGLAVAVRRNDPGPGLIRLARIGHGGRRFGQWKLRTMRAEGRDGASLGPAITAAGDTRVTSIGRRLRRYRLDEVPQLLNVVAGAMALVGPRPETPAYVDQTDPVWQEVLSVRPGIVGPTQVLVADWEAEVVAGSPDPDPYRSVVLPIKLAIDRWYVQNASPAVDVLVAVALVRRFLGSERSSTLFRRVVAEVPEARALALGRFEGGQRDLTAEVRTVG